MSVYVQDILLLCQNRVVLFDNKCKDAMKKYNQVQELLILVNKVISQNGGQPFTDEIFAEAKVIMCRFFLMPVNKLNNLAVVQ